MTPFGVSYRPRIPITRDPSRADVYLAGKKMGETPYSNNKVISCKYSLTLRKELFMPVEKQRIETQDENGKLVELK